jgi:hypothetical protein
MQPMARHKSNIARPTVALEVCHSRLHLAIVESAGPNGALVARTCSVDWRREAASLHSPAGRQEFSEALMRLASQEKLRGARARLAISHRYCVTRVATGDRERVQQEMEWMTGRSALYLGLGPGRKSLATAVETLDARHQLGLLAVTNTKLLDAVLQAAARAGLQIEQAEPSLVVLSRLLGCCGGDAAAPQLVVNLADDALELGISYRGQLLLDYRPGGQKLPDEVASLLARHWHRLNRYCQRYCGETAGPHAAGNLQRVYLCGPAEAVVRARESFRRCEQLAVETIEMSQLDIPCTLDKRENLCELAPALGAALASGLPGDRTGPDFLLRHVAAQREALWPVLARACWPLAAAAVAAALMWGLNYGVRSGCADLAARIEAHQPQRDKAWQLQAEIARNRVKALRLRQLQQKLQGPPWDQVVLMLAQCLPDGVWLRQLEVEQNQLKISGSSYSDDGVYEFVRWLHTVPGVEMVQLESMQRQQLPSGPGTLFDVKLSVFGLAAGTKGSAGNG